ncbi:MAG TPA: hypothetical protein VNO30_15160 [Kofleriaceae bacterium]|nr:hypothetical protein [Kofleriaceae bacterium]
MLRRLLAPLFLVAFFAALPAWFLSSREGWIAIDCARASESAALDCTVRERFAFSSRSATYATLGADTERREVRGRRGRATTFQLVLATPDGEREVLREPTGNAALKQAAADLDAAVRAREPTFHAEVSPDTVFWIAASVLAVFTAAALFLAWSRRARAREHAPAGDAPP